jgi:hypothetical protein
MSTGTLVTRLRSYHYAAGLLANQQNDPLCCQCVAFARTADGIISSFIKFESSHAGEKKKVSMEFEQLFQDVRDELDLIQQPEGPIRQKKEGNCLLPKGVCFTKEIITFLEKTDSLK